MALTPTFGAGGDYEVAEEGKYLCTITKVVAEDRPSFDDQSVLEPNYVWDFETVKEKDSKNNPFKFRAYTKQKYVAGNDKAKLTLLIDGLLGRSFTAEQVAQMDMEKFIGKTCGVMVGITSSSKNKVLSVRAVKSHPISFAQVMRDGADMSVVPEEETDPFKND